jgi:hypothetical protein
VVRSVGSKGDSYDNAAAEAVNSLHKKVAYQPRGPSQDVGDTVATAEWVCWYNNERLHSACGDIPPTEYEKDWLTAQADTIMNLEAKASSASNEPGSAQLLNGHGAGDHRPVGEWDRQAACFRLSRC